MHDQRAEAPARGEHGGFGKKLANETATGRAERCPNCQFVPAGRSASQKKACHIRARDQQDQRDDDSEGAKEACYREKSERLHSLDARDSTNVNLRLPDIIRAMIRHRLVEFPQNRFEPLSYGAVRYSRRDAYQKCHCFIFRFYRHVDIWCQAQTHEGPVIVRQDADHRVDFSVEYDGPAYGVRSTSKPSLPETIADHRSAMIISGDSAALCDRHAHRFEKVGSDANFPQR